MIWSKERIQETLDLFGPKYEQMGETLSEQDAIEILDNMTQLANLLIELDIKQRKELRKKARLVEKAKVPKGSDKFVNADELAKILNVPVSWIYSRTRLGNGEIPHVKVGKYIRFNPHEVIEHFKGKTE